jgi:putative membrane protein
MVVTGLVIVGIAALIHGYIFFLESFSWTSERTRAVFGTSAEDASATRQLAFNQGFYNLFLAVQVIAGIIAFTLGVVPVGATLIFAGAGSMVLAGTVLVASDPTKASAALKQLLPPLVGLIVLAIGLS